MEAISYKLPDFEGPLDLLLFLVQKNKLNILDIPIHEVLDQYMEAIRRMQEADLDVATEFLEMAARLVHIKSSMLLPRHEEAEELKRELQGRLIEYSVCKQAAARLSDEYVGDKIFVKKPTLPDFDKTYHGKNQPEELIKAYLGLSDRKLRQKPVEASIFKPIVSHKIVSVTTGIMTVLRRLYKTGKCSLVDVMDKAAGKSEKIAVFLAVLELTKSGRISINDDNTEITFTGRRRRNAAQ